MQEESPLANLASTIDQLISCNDYVPLVEVARVVHIPEEVLAGALPHSSESSPTAGERIANFFYDSFKRETLINSVDSISNRTYLVTMFDILRNRSISQTSLLLQHHAVNSYEIEANLNVLIARKRTLQATKTPSAFPEEWNEELRRFSREHLAVGFAMDQSTFKSSPTEVQDHFAAIQLNDVPGRFIHQKLELLLLKSDGNPEAARALNGYEYEHQIAAIIRDHVPGAHVEVTKASGDQGADIVFTFGRHRVVIQTKLYSNSVGNDAVQQIYAAKRHYRATAAVVVTNARYTTSAQELAESVGVALLHEDDVGTMFAAAFT